MTLKTTAAVLAALTFLATPITAQTATTIAGVDLAALKAKCVVNNANDCDAATEAALNAFKLQNPTPAQINAQIGLIAAILIPAANADSNLWRISFAIFTMRRYTTDKNQDNALNKIRVAIATGSQVSLAAFASALSPS